MPRIGPYEELNVLLDPRCQPGSGPKRGGCDHGASATDATTSRITVRAACASQVRFTHLGQRALRDRRRCFERVAASLRPNGRFAWNAFAFDHHIASAIDGQHAEAAPGVPSPHTIGYSVSDNRVDVTLDDGGTGSLWWATKNEWLGLLDVVGLQLEALYGGFAGEQLDDDSREYVFVART